MHLALGVWAIFWLLFWVHICRPWLQRRREAKAARRMHAMLYPQAPDHERRNIVVSVLVAVAAAVILLPLAIAAHQGGP